MIRALRAAPTFCGGGCDWKDTTTSAKGVGDESRKRTHARNSTEGALDALENIIVNGSGRCH